MTDKLNFDPETQKQISESSLCREPVGVPLAASTAMLWAEVAAMIWAPEIAIPARIIDMGIGALVGVRAGQEKGQWSGEMHPIGYPILYGAMGALDLATWAAAEKYLDPLICGPKGLGDSIMQAGTTGKLNDKNPLSVHDK